MQEHGENGRLFKALRFIALLLEHEPAGRGGEPGVGEVGLSLGIIGGAMKQARGARGQTITTDQRGADRQAGQGAGGFGSGLAGQSPPESAGLRESAAAVVMGGEGGGVGGIAGGQAMRVTDHDLFVAQLAGQFGGEHGEGQVIGVLFAQTGQHVEGFVFAIGLSEQSHHAHLHGGFIGEVIAFEQRDGAGGLVVAFAQIGQVLEIGDVVIGVIEAERIGSQGQQKMFEAGDGLVVAAELFEGGGDESQGDGMTRRDAGDLTPDCNGVIGTLELHERFAAQEQLFDVMGDVGGR